MPAVRRKRPARPDRRWTRGATLAGTVAALCMSGGGCSLPHDVHLSDPAPIHEPPPAHERPPVLHPPEPPKPRPLHILSVAASRLLQRAQEDAVTRDVVCFAYDTFYDKDTHQLALPSSEDFTTEVLQEVAPPDSALAYATAAQDVYDDLQELEQGEFLELAVDLQCA